VRQEICNGQDPKKKNCKKTNTKMEKKQHDMGQTGRRQHEPRKRRPELGPKKMSARPQERKLVVPTVKVKLFSVGRKTEIARHANFGRKRSAFKVREGKRGGQSRGIGQKKTALRGREN